jgi:hypothetical protein
MTCGENIRALISICEFFVPPTRLKETIHKAFGHRNYGSKFVVLGYNSTYFSNKIQKGKTCYSEEQVISILVEEGHNSYPLVCRRPAETVSLQRRQICYR